MPAVLAAAQAFVAAHPLLCAVALYLALNALVGVVPVRYHDRPWYGALLALTARAAMLVPPDVRGTLKLPGAPVPPALPPPLALGNEPPRGQSGHVRVETLMDLAWLAAFLGLVVAWFGIAGCPMPAPDGCTPLDTRCSPAGVPETCSATQRWSHGALAQPCAASGAAVVCCRTPSAYGGRPVAACVPRAACVPDEPDASNDAADAAGGP